MDGMKKAKNGDGENQEENPRVMKALGRERKGTTRLPDPSFVVIDGEASCGRKEGKGREIGMREKGLICMKSIDG